MVQDGFEPQCPSLPFMQLVYRVHIWLDTCVHTYMHARTEMQVCTHSPSPSFTCPNMYTDNYATWYSQPFTASQPGPVTKYAPEGEHGIRPQSSACRLPGERCAADQPYGSFETGTPRSKVG